MRLSLVSEAVTAAALALVLLSAPATAQVMRVANTGCRQAAYPTPVGSPALGQGFGVSCPVPLPNTIPFVVLGQPGFGAVLAPPLACAGPCVLYPRPAVVLPGATAWRIVVPNDPRLVGACVGIQCGSVSTFSRCVELSGALLVCVTR